MKNNRRIQYLKGFDAGQQHIMHQIAAMARGDIKKIVVKDVTTEIILISKEEKDNE